MGSIDHDVDGFSDRAPSVTLVDLAFNVPGIDIAGLHHLAINGSYQRPARKYTSNQWCVQKCVFKGKQHFGLELEAKFGHRQDVQEYFSLASGFGAILPKRGCSRPSFKLLDRAANLDGSF